MNKKRLFLLVLLGLVVLYFLGPTPAAPEFSFQLPNDFPTSLNQTANYVADRESVFNTKPDNASYLQWADSVPNKTKYSLVYLHGFSASPGEGLPISNEIASEFGMNLYVPRLAAHGLNTEEPLLDFSSEAYIQSAYEAIKMGELLGDEVIVMSCSTGSTASLYTLAESDVKVKAQIMYAPNIEIADSKAGLLTMPWGLQLARLVKGGDYNIWEVPEGAEKYWYGTYRLEGAVELKNLVNHTMMEETFQKITVPTFVGYYYKDEDHQDHVVSVSAIQEMISQLAVPKEQLIDRPFTSAEAHPIQSKFFSKSVDEVMLATEEFLENQLGIKKPN